MCIGYRLIGFLMLCVLFVGCPDPTPAPQVIPGPTPVAVSRTDTYSGTGPAVYLVATSGFTDLTYTLDLGSNTRNVFFVITNTAQTDSGSNPVVVNQSGGEAASINSASSFEQNISSNPLDYAMPGNPEIDEWNRNPPVQPIEKPAGLSKEYEIPEPPLFDTVGGTQDFYYDSLSNIIPATCRKVVSDSGHTLNIWVANDCWYPTGTKTYQVNQAMVDAMADSFLKAGSDNDIYEWLTNIYGPEWGTPPYTNLIPADGQITILLYDIGGNDINPTEYTLGFFWSKDNYKKTGDYSIAYSNARLMFYIDAVWYAVPDPSPAPPVVPPGDTSNWNVSDPWPEEIISALTHEFQHMIHYYQKKIVNQLTGYSETWLNEMCSLVSEDFVASKLHVDGPRGVTYSDGTAGSVNNYNGRFPLLNYYNTWPVCVWGTDQTTSLRSYSINYAFGSYLARNFGGPDFFSKIVHNTSTNYLAIENELISGGTGETFASVLRKWGAALLLSDTTTPPVGNYKYNKGSFDDFTVGAITYSLGSINQFNYYQRKDSSFLTATGPYLFTSLSTGTALQDSVRFQHTTSNIYYQAGTSATGIKIWNIRMEDGVNLTVVVK